MAERLTDLAVVAAVEDPEATASDLLVVYRGVLTSMMVEPVDQAIERGRTLARRCVGTDPNR